MNRRKFIESTARGGLAAVLALTAGIMVRRGQVSRKNHCTPDNFCADCGILDRCDLPQAVNERRNRRK